MISDLPDWRSLAIDAPGHGDSRNGKRNLVECGNDIAESMELGCLVGYSMGARMSLHTALQHPEMVNQLVLISGTAGISDANERQARIDSDENLADHIEDVGVAVFIEEWLANPMFRGLSQEKAQIPERVRNSSEGLANSLRFAGTGTQQPLWDRLHELQMPVLLVAGQRDAKFVQLAERMHQLIPSSSLHIIEESGHTVHLENHDEFVKVLRHFLLGVQRNY